MLRIQNKGTKKKIKYEKNEWKVTFPTVQPKIYRFTMHSLTSKAFELAK